MKRKLAYTVFGIISAVLIYKAISFGIETRNYLVAEMKSGGSIGSLNRAENIQLANLNSENK